MLIVRFEPVGVQGSALTGESVFAVARRLGVPIATACTGNGNCGLCWVTLEHGADAVTPPSHVERRAHVPPEFVGAPGQPRLACQARVMGEGPSEVLTVRVSRRFSRVAP